MRRASLSPAPRAIPMPEEPTIIDSGGSADHHLPLDGSFVPHDRASTRESLGFCSGLVVSACRKLYGLYHSRGTAVQAYQVRSKICALTCTESCIPRVLIRTRHGTPSATLTSTVTRRSSTLPAERRCSGAGHLRTRVAPGHMSAIAKYRQIIGDKRNVAAVEEKIVPPFFRPLASSALTSPARHPVIVLAQKDHVVR